MIKPISSLRTGHTRGYGVTFDGIVVVIISGWWLRTSRAGP